jgi:hypothetical protein
MGLWDAILGDQELVIGLGEFDDVRAVCAVNMEYNRSSSCKETTGFECFEHGCLS